MPRRVRHLAAAAERAPADERHHRMDLQRDHQQEQRHLDPEERRAEVERATLLQARERTQESRHEPEGGGDAPGRVGGKQPTKAHGVDRGAERAAAQPHGGQTDGKREHVESGDNGGHTEHGEGIVPMSHLFAYLSRCGFDFGVDAVCESAITIERATGMCMSVIVRVYLSMLAVACWLFHVICGRQSWRFESVSLACGVLPRADCRRDR